MSKIQFLNNNELVSFEITVNGKSLNATYNVISIEVNRVVNEIPHATVSLAIDPNEKSGPDMDDTLVPGNEIEIMLGYDQSINSIFKGLITSQSIHSHVNSNYILSLHSHEEAIKLTKEVRSITFENLTDSQIINQIVSENGLESEIEATSQEFPQLIQYQEKDWDFMLKRAAANGMIVYVEDGVVKVKKPLQGGSSVLDLTNGIDINDIEATLESDQQKSGRVGFSGSHLPKINTSIGLKGLGKHFDGDVLVTRVHHLLRESYWKTEVGFGLLPDLLQPQQSAAINGLSPSLQTRSGLKIELNDEENTVTLVTPNGNTCSLSDQDKSVILKDEYGSEIEMNATGITLKSAKDITLDATGKINLKASQKIDLKSSGEDVSISGLNVIANGEVGATVKGGASAELSADGQTTVKGAMVMIN